VKSPAVVSNFIRNSPSVAAPSVDVFPASQLTEGNVTGSIGSFFLVGKQPTHTLTINNKVQYFDISKPKNT
jgi:hypothetical protein